MATQIQLRRGTASEWETENPVLAAGEAGVETDTGQFKGGDGSTAWNSLPYSTDNATPDTDDDYVHSSESTTSTSYTDLATPGPEVTVNVGGQGVLEVYFAMNCFGDGQKRMSIALSGANTRSADNAWSTNSPTDGVMSAGTFMRFTGLNAGATTVTAKYMTTSGSATFGRRRLMAKGL